MDGPSLSSVPPGSADGRGLSVLLGPLNYRLNGLLSELGLFFVEAGWARLPEGLLMTGETTPLLLGTLCPSGVCNLALAGHPNSWTEGGGEDRVL